MGFGIWMINFWVCALVVALVKFISHKIFLPKSNANWILGFGFLCDLLIL